VFVKSDSADESGLAFADSREGVEATDRFNAFYDYAFPRVYRYAQRRMQNEAQAQTLCRRVLVRAVTALGGIDIVEGMAERMVEGTVEGMIEHRVQQDEAEFAYWLFCLARRTADQLCTELSEHPDLLLGSDLEGEGDDLTIELLRGALTTPRSASAEAETSEREST
jgi:DNA-directed RNA polymerase specialized sigma24 family protein